ncbi:pyrimidine reductase family protein [Arthrobacter pityocampae]|uniref:Pyrimidine reductase family protein n=1 Tax=Arthrobacter pityocampae TaxID=547334 RepID=A0A2S5J1Y1_9MICC|nr:pyrimidine reductase family protein [Arthrobacter pityocampae]PPB50814.1 pyrimidine reductase family protein [Arthrobacter pityocampae]
MITSLVPATGAPVDDDALHRIYAYPVGDRPYVRFNFVAAADGAATSGGFSAGLGNDGDQRIFAVLRRLADVVLVGAGTIRAEGYGGELVDDDARAWRRTHGLAAHPAVAVISGSLALDPSTDFFRRAPVRPLVLTSASAPADRRAALERVADVVDCGADTVEAHAVLAELGRRGLPRILCEGGPAVLGDFTRSGAVDELCLSISPLLVGGDGPRIAVGSSPDDALALELSSLLTEDSALYTLYRRTG